MTETLPPARRMATGRTMFHRFAAAVRWLHIYISLLGFSALVFFSITGITLNHPDWFGTGGQRINELQGEIKLEWLHVPQSPGLRRAANLDIATSGPEATADDASADTASAEEDLSAQVAKLEVVEYLRQHCHLRGAVGEFRVDESECLILFKGPGYSADTIINRETGKYTVTETLMGPIAIINDLHKGRDTGPIWSWVIDISAAVTILISITGVILIFYLKRKRWSGIITAVIGTIILAAAYALWVP